MEPIKERGKPRSALSASLGGMGSTEPALLGGSSSSSGTRPSILQPERAVDEVAVASTPSRSILGASPMSQHGERWHAAPRGSSAASSANFVGSLGTSFTAGHSFLLNSFDRRRHYAPVSECLSV